MKLKKLPIGLSDFKEIIERNYYYVDKSLFIKDIIDSSSKVSLITRPRRFGKTTNLSMIQYFFEKYEGNVVMRASSSQTDSLDQDGRATVLNAHLFQHLKIWKLGEEYTEHCGKYPVVSLTFKDVKEPNWNQCEAKLRKLISEEYNRHIYLLSGNSVTGQYRVDFEKILKREADMDVFKDSLKNLTQYLYKHYNQKVVVLIDEYDTPVHEAYDKGYYDNIIDFLRSFLGAGLKDNLCIEKAVITGILRISKESIFSDLNNFDVYTTLNNHFSDKFGLTEGEVWDALNYYQLDSFKEGVKDWYNGYVFGKDKDIYNPWSILNFINKNDEGLKPYWVNTSSNLLVKKLLTNAGSDAKRDMELLLTGQPISKEVVVDTVFADVEKNSETLWSFLLFSGYLKVTKQEFVNKKLYCDLMIPNREVEYVYDRFISSWLTDNLQSSELNLLLTSLLNGDAKNLNKFLKKFVMNSMSYFDPTGKEPEKVYHAFVLGLLLQLSDSYRIKSNGESGYGRYDITLIPKKISNSGVIIEFKKVDHDDQETLETAVQSALQQIEKMQYEAELKEMGVTTIYKYGIAFDGKEVVVRG